MLDERSKKVLCAVIQNYIHYPDPVGSRTVAKKYSFGLSSATIRNIMADLEEMGFLTHPHTSAGRIPTHRGYRLYVDSLMTKGDCSNKAIILTDQGLINSKIISSDLNLTQKDLNRIAGYLNAELSGYTFDEIRQKVIREMSREKKQCDTLISNSLNICREAFFSSYGDLFIAGLSEVLELPDFADLQKIKELSRAVEDKHAIIKLLDKLSESDGVQIIIGAENTMDEMKELSLVVSTCKQA